jgi:hypothetical protein
MQEKIELPFPKGEYVVADVERLNDLTRVGWRVVRVVEDEVVDYAPKVSQMVATSQDYGQTWERQQLSRVFRVVSPLAMRRTRYLLWLDEASALAKLTAELADAKLSAANAQCAAAEAKAAAFLAELNKKEDALADQAIDNQHLRADLERQGVTKRAMEADLGKLRESIGTKQFREILGRDG